jgi:hypothetical protein
MADQHAQDTARSSSDLSADQQGEQPTSNSVSANEVVGHTASTDKPKTIEVEVDGREAVVSIGREKVRLDRHSIPTLQQVLQRAFMEVS